MVRKQFASVAMRPVLYRETVMRPDRNEKQQNGGTSNRDTNSEEGWGVGITNNDVIS
jgi:hypothetical protein